MVAARVRAETIRRSGGEWIVVGLAAYPLPLREPGDMPPPPTTQTTLERLLNEYRKAFEAQDIDRLKRVWLMNPDERSTLEHVFARARGINLRIESAKFKTEGARGWMEFDQFMAVDLGEPGDLSAGGVSGRVLGAHDSFGAWALPHRTAR